VNVYCTSHTATESTRDPLPNPRNHRPNSRSLSRGDTTPTLCWYHHLFGARVEKCTTPCAYCQQRKPTQQTSPVAHVRSTTTGCLFIKDKSSKRQFLVDTGSDLCVYPHRLIPRCKERANYDLCVANGTTIHTYGWLPLPQFGSTSGSHVVVCRSRCHTPHHRCGFSLPFWPLGGLPKQPTTGWNHVAVSNVGC
jgi:hypothetical protein